MIPLIVQVGAYMIPSGVFTIWVHLAPTAWEGSNCHIWFVEPTLMLNPPRMYSLLLATANPPGRMVPRAPGQSSPVRVVAVSVAGSEENTRAAAGVCPAAAPPTQ